MSNFIEGARGYGDLFKQGYGLKTIALSTALFKYGLACGLCFEIMCVSDPQWCIPNAGSIIVTATNFCPPNYSKPNDIWCNPPQKYFDLSMPMFTKIAQYKAGVIPIRFRRVACAKSKGNPHWLLVLVYNVGNAGDVSKVRVKGSRTDWIIMSRNWGQNWQTGNNLVGQSLSFQVRTSDAKWLQFDNVAPSNWQFGQTYDGKRNF